jgi:hypothetical protein
MGLRDRSSSGSMPVEFIRERKCHFFNVQHATVPLAGRAARGMKEQRAHEHGVASSNPAKNIGLPGA